VCVREREREREKVGARYPWLLYPLDAIDNPTLSCDNQVPHGIAKYLVGTDMAIAEEDGSPESLL